MNLEGLLKLPIRLYCVATGAGAGIQKMLWEVPGASSFLVESIFPYAPARSAKFAGITPKTFASEEFALDLAAAAYVEAMDDPTKDPVGLALTASVASIKEHRGDHRLHMVCMTKDKILGKTLVLAKGTSMRTHDGYASDTATLDLLLATLDIGGGLYEDYSQQARRRFFEHPVFHPNGGRTSENSIDDRPLFPGAFDPPHAGHETIADSVAHPEVADLEPVFAICVDHPIKAPLSVQGMLRRASLLKHRTVLFTEGDPLYIDKARKHPGRPIILGADALLRMLDHKWTEVPRTLFDEFRTLGTKFFVFGRKIGEDFISASEAIVICAQHGVPRDLFQALDGRWDISSSAIREHKG